MAGIIPWDHWWRVYRWSQGGYIRQARKIQRCHLYPKNQEKMRNELAEQVLDEQFLFAMRVSSVNEVPQVNDFSITLLQTHDTKARENNSQVVIR